MERIIHLAIERLPEGPYLGTSDDVQGLVVQADTIAELVEYAEDVARILLEMDHEGRTDPVPTPRIVEQFVEARPIAA